MLFAFWSLSALEHVQGLHHHWHVSCFSGLWSGITLCRTSVQLLNPSDTTHSPRPICDLQLQPRVVFNPAAVADFLNLDN